MVGYIKSLHTHLRTLLSDTQDGGGFTQRHLQHMKYLEFFQKGRRGSVQDVDIENIMFATDADTIFHLQEDEAAEAVSMLPFESVSSSGLDSDEDS